MLIDLWTCSKKNSHCWQPSRTWEERPELMEHLRSFPIKRYLAFYVAVAEGIELVRVLPVASDITVEDFATAGNA